MTDPRIEAAARALCIADGHDPDGNDSHVQSGMGANWCAFKDNAQAALAAADAAAWRPVLGREGNYEISFHGVIRRADKTLVGTWKNAQGYILARLDAPRETVRVHRLVAQA